MLRYDPVINPIHCKVTPFFSQTHHPCSNSNHKTILNTLQFNFRQILVWNWTRTVQVMAFCSHLGSKWDLDEKRVKGWKRVPWWYGSVYKNHTYSTNGHREWPLVAQSTASHFKETRVIHCNYSLINFSDYVCYFQ